VRCVEDKRPLYQLSSKRLEDNWKRTTLPVVLEALRGQLEEWSFVLYKRELRRAARPRASRRSTSLEEPVLA